MKDECLGIIIRASPANFIPWAWAAVGEEEGAALAAVGAAGYFEQVWAQIWVQIWVQVGVELTPPPLRERFPE